MSSVADAKKVAFDYIDAHRQDMVDWLCKLIDFKSTAGAYAEGGEELEIQQWLRDEVQQWQIFSNIDYWFVDSDQKRPNLVGVLGNLETNKHNLILNAHVDVVPVTVDEQGRWNTDPWKGTVKGDRIFGRGACDDKGGVTAIMWAARSIAESAVQIKNHLIVEAVMGEEQAQGIGSIAAVNRGYTAPFAVVAEPTDLEIKVATVGNFDFKLTVVGKEIHTGMRNRILYPQRHGLASGAEVGVDAIEKMFKFTTAFRDLEKQWTFRWRHDLFDDPMAVSGLGPYTINVTQIRGGTYLGAVPGQCEITGEVYYPSWVKGEEIISEMQSIVDHITLTDDWLKKNPPKLEAPRTFHQPGYEINRDHAGCNVIATAFRDVTGLSPRIAAFQASGDWNFIGNLGIPVVVFGPEFQGAHGPNENISIDALVKVCKTLAATTIEWCGVE
ncbi:MAG TPA: M20/M25/M40 family metallo-hydrolase [Candidatus Acidoferrum sp.]|nr:M20/M25/M40 family metallo-hydrolase [Candidatus Acidoferrum sp.]